ncbi:GIN4 kinase Cdr1 [Pseudozyma hubeiensis]|nr:GIN4 kinase Cdr1 [Pseudozyma hubeiensis]
MKIRCPITTKLESGKQRASQRTDQFAVAVACNSRACRAGSLARFPTLNSTLDFQHRQLREPKHTQTHAEQSNSGRCSSATDSETRAIPSHRPCQSSHPSSLLHRSITHNDIAAHRLARSLRFC